MQTAAPEVAPFINGALMSSDSEVSVEVINPSDGLAAYVWTASKSEAGTEAGLAGMESYLRRQLLWFSHS